MEARNRRGGIALSRTRMSIAVMTAVWQRLDVVEELVLALALADWADDDGTNIFPSVELLQHKTRKSRRTVQRQLRALERVGWLELVSPRKGGQYLSAEYRISAAWLKGVNLTRLPDRTPFQSTRRNRAIRDTKQRHQRHVTASPVTPNSSGSVITHQSSSFDVGERSGKRRILATVNGLAIAKGVRR
jgi:hypothetical protein